LVDDRSSLLNQLKIDRDAQDEPSRAWRWVLLGILLAAATGAGGWYYLGMPGPVLIQVATASSVSSGTSVARTSALDASGYVIARRQATVSSKITGRVIEVLIEEGQEVAEGEVVARLDGANARARVAQNRAQLAQQRASLEAAQVALENAEPTFERAQSLLKGNAISSQDFDSARATYDSIRTNLAVTERTVAVAEANLALAQQDLDDTIVRAPFGGVVTVKAAQEGEMVSPVSAGGGFTRTGIGTIVDMDSLEVEVDVSENFINRVQPGQDVSVILNAYPDWAIPSHVIAIIPTADRAKATVRVRVGFDQRDPRILPQMGVRVAFLASDTDAGAAAQAARQLVIVPAAAVAASGSTGTVFVVQNDTLERRMVQLGGRMSDGAQIVLSGLSAGTRVAIADFSLLVDGARVRIDAAVDAN
jgi:RND family efflux transporter MFP subunit